MNKGISTSIALIIIIVCASLTGLIAWKYQLIPEISISGSSSILPENGIADLTEQEQACMNSGGTVTIAMCCENTDDFPNLCLIGPCGCSPENSHEVKICDCGPDECFDKTGCVPFCPTCSGQ